MTTAVAIDVDDAEAAAPSPGPRERAAAALGLLAEVAVWLAAAIAFTWPLADQLGDRVIGSGDGEYYAWLGWRVGELIRGGTILPTEIPDVVHPYGFDLRLAEGYLPTYVNGLWNLLTGPVAAYNLSVLTACLLNAWGGRALARTVSTRRVVWILTAVAVSTTPALAMRVLGHYTLVWVFPASFLVAHGVGVALGRHALRPLRVGALLFLGYLCSTYFLVVGAGALVVLAAFGAWRARTLLRTARSFAIGGVVCALLMAPFALERLRFDADERDAGRDLSFDLDYRVYSADASGFFAESVVTRWELPWSDESRAGGYPNQTEVTVFPGYVLLVGLGAFVLLRSRLRAPVVIATVGVVLLSLGPTFRVWGHVAPDVPGPPNLAAGWLPFELVTSLPIVDNLRAPGRLALALPALAGLALAVSLDTVLARVRSRVTQVFVVGVTSALLLLNVPLTAFTSELGGSEEVQGALREVRARAGPGDTMLEVPADCKGAQIEFAAFQIDARVPLVGCQAQYLALPWWSGLDLYLGSEPLASLRCDPNSLIYRSLPQYAPDLVFDQARLDALRGSLGVRFFVIERAALEAPACARLQAPGALGVLDTLRVVGGDADYLVLDAGPGS